MCSQQPNRKWRKAWGSHRLFEQRNYRRYSAYLGKTTITTGRLNICHSKLDRRSKCRQCRQSRQGSDGPCKSKRVSLTSECFFCRMFRNLGFMFSFAYSKPIHSLSALPPVLVVCFGHSVDITDAVLEDRETSGTCLHWWLKVNERSGGLTIRPYDCRCLLRRPFRMRLDSSAGFEALLKVVDDIINMFNANRDSNHVLGDTWVKTFLFRELLVCRGPRVDGESLCITDTTWTLVPSHTGWGLIILGQVRNHLEPIHNLRSGFSPSLDTKRKNPSKSSWQILLGQSVVRMTLQARIRDPRHALVLLKPPRKCQGIGRVSLAP